MRNALCSIHELCEIEPAGYFIVDYPAPRGFPAAVMLPSQSALSPRIDYDIPTYIRRGIKLTGMPARAGRSKSA